MRSRSWPSAPSSSSGQIVDTNSAWMGEQLALAGIDSHFHQVVGDNQARIVLALRSALARSDGVVVCGGLGPTHDDITRDAIAEVMNVPLVRDPAIVARIADMFSSRGRDMPESNGRQADVPGGRRPIPQAARHRPRPHLPGRATRWSTRCPASPTSSPRCSPGPCSPTYAGRADVAGEAAVIMSRVVRTWGMSESGLGELLAPRIAALDAAGGNPTIAFLASGIEGIKVRITAKAPDAADGRRAARRRGGRGAGARRARSCSASTTTTMESAVAELLVERGLTLGLAESLTGGLVASRLVGVAGRQPMVPGLGGELRLGGQAHRPRRAAGPGGQRAGGPRHGDGGRAASWAPTWAWPSPAWPAPTSQEGVAPGTVIVGLALPGPSRSQSSSTCPVTASGSASTRPSPPSTCCAAGSWPRRRRRRRVRGDVFGLSGCHIVVTARRAVSDSVRPDRCPVQLDGHQRIFIVRARSQHGSMHRTQSSGGGGAKNRAGEVDGVPDYDKDRHWSSVGDQIRSRSDDNVLAGDDAPYYRYKADLFSTKFLPQVPIEGHSVLEVGCGAGRNLSGIASLHPGRLVGCDVAGQMVALSKQRIGDAAEVVQVDGAHLPFSDKEFDVVTTVTVLQHNPDEARATLIEEICRVSGGEVFLFEDTSDAKPHTGRRAWPRVSTRTSSDVPSSGTPMPAPATDSRSSTPSSKRPLSVT